MPNYCGSLSAATPQPFLMWETAARKLHLNDVKHGLASPQPQPYFLTPVAVT